MKSTMTDSSSPKATLMLLSKGTWQSKSIGLLGKGPPSEWKRRMNIQKCSHLIPGIYCHSCSIQFIIYGGPMERYLLDSSTWGTVVQLHQGSNILWVQTLLFFYCNYCTKQGEIWCRYTYMGCYLVCGFYGHSYMIPKRLHFAVPVHFCKLCVLV